MDAKTAPQGSFTSLTGGHLPMRRSKSKRGERCTERHTVLRRGAGQMRVLDTLMDAGTLFVATVFGP
jgi:hypothetical protein